MLREELIRIIEVILNGGYDAEKDKQLSESEIDRLVNIFVESISCPYGSDLIFFPIFAIFQRK